MSPTDSSLHKLTMGYANFGALWSVFSSYNTSKYPRSTKNKNSKLKIKTPLHSSVITFIWCPAFHLFESKLLIVLD